MSKAAIELVERLQARWDTADGLVLADWCEETGLEGAANLLRIPTVEARWRAVNLLAGCLGVRDLSEYGLPHGAWASDAVPAVRTMDVRSAYPPSLVAENSWAHGWTQRSSDRNEDVQRAMDAERASVQRAWDEHREHAGLPGPEEAPQPIETRSARDGPMAERWAGLLDSYTSSIARVAVFGIRPVTLGPGESYDCDVWTGQPTTFIWIRFGRACLDALSVCRLAFGRHLVVYGDQPVPARLIDERMLDVGDLRIPSCPTLNAGQSVRLEVKNETREPVRVIAGFIGIMLEGA